MKNDILKALKELEAKLKKMSDDELAELVDSSEYVGDDVEQYAFLEGIICSTHNYFSMTSELSYEIDICAVEENVVSAECDLVYVDFDYSKAA